ncbi:hypothetical protein HanPSC8_Chr08g0340981 [Helianthus annuus]|nr:hypothetical protein HanPSC8_Chr08g0340981 [Helianthus annuus]
MQVAMEPSSGFHVLQPNDGSGFYVVSRFVGCLGLRSNNLDSIGIVYFRKTSNRLLPTAGSIWHIMRV